MKNKDDTKQKLSTKIIREFEIKEIEKSKV